jgi:hypothetical protein
MEFLQQPPIEVEAATPPPPPPTKKTEIYDAKAAVAAAVVPSRSMLFYTLTSTLPILVLTAIVFLTPLKGASLVALSFVGIAVSLLGLGRLLYELTYDIAGDPNYKLPVWAVFYLIIYLLSAFTFLYFSIHVAEPGLHFAGFEQTQLPKSLLDSLYLSICYYLGDSPDASISMRTQLSRFLTVSQGLLATFLNAVIIAKFVNTF